MDKLEKDRIITEYVKSEEKFLPVVKSIYSALIGETMAMKNNLPSANKDVLESMVNKLDESLVVFSRYDKLEEKLVDNEERKELASTEKKILNLRTKLTSLFQHHEKSPKELSIMLLDSDILDDLDKLLKLIKRDIDELESKYSLPLAA